MSIACITGASSGIGKEFAKRLSHMGYRLILISRNTDRLHELARTLPTPCKVIGCDLSDENKCIELAKRLSNYNISILVNNAGFGDLGPFTETALDKDMNMINVNIKAMHILTKAILPNMIKKDSGYIINVASSAGLLPGGPYMSTYYSTKSYVTSFTGAVYNELKAAASRVHVCALCPGPVDTSFNETAGVSFSLPGISAEYCVSQCLKQVARKRLIIIPEPSMRAAVLFSRFVPRRLLLTITAHQQKKKI